MSPDRKFRKPRLWSHPRILMRRILRCWPFLVWASAIGVVLYLQSEVVQYGIITGVVYTDEQTVAPPDTARLEEVPVAVGDRVKAGDVLARMDTSLLDAEIATEEALALEDEETFARYQESILRMARQFGADVTDAEADLAGDRLGQMQAEAELAELRRELHRREGLLSKRLIREEEVAILRPQIAALDKAVAAYPELIAIRRRAVETAKAERLNMRQWLRLGEGESVSDAIERKRKIRSLTLGGMVDVRKKARDRYILRAAQDGEVSRVYYVPGETVTAGDPVVRIVKTDRSHVVGFLRETQYMTVKVGQVVSVWREAENRKQQSSGVVVSVSPDIQWLPELVSPIAGQQVRGRRIKIRLTDEHALLPGETVQIVPDARTWVGTLGRLLNLARGGREEAE